MRVVFFGSGAFGIPSLRRLIETHEVGLIVTQPDRRAGRGSKMAPTPIAELAVEIAPEVPVLKPERVNTPELRDQIRAVEADIWVVIAYGQKLGQKLLTDKPAVNLHGSLLPRWRGAAPINAAVVAGDTRTGTSVITLVDEMDAGDVLGTSERPIEPHQTAGELHDLLAEDGVTPLMQVLDDAAKGELKPVAQDQLLVTLAPKISREDARIDFGWDADRCRCLIHGYNPWPGVTVSLGGDPLKLLRAESLSGGVPGEPGAIVDPQDGLVVCARGALRLLEVQPAGKKPMPWAAYIRGRPITKGERLEP
ncbi:MAG: methionyl-tRNA formyltransferase [Phycisphaerales bacterium]|nr:methionyl-tRNA formyltransferase [Phycisphaerales bacterium]MCB9836366.1 methionyl-tRNA formyltransferase [Phycisphaera sp.]